MSKTCPKQESNKGSQSRIDGRFEKRVRKPGAAGNRTNKEVFAYLSSGTPKRYERAVGVRAGQGSGQSSGGIRHIGGGGQFVEGQPGDAVHQHMVFVAPVWLGFLSSLFYQEMGPAFYSIGVIFGSSHGRKPLVLLHFWSFPHGCKFSGKGGGTRNGRPKSAKDRKLPRTRGGGTGPVRAPAPPPVDMPEGYASSP